MRFSMTEETQMMNDQRFGIRKIVYYSEEILLENGLSPAVPAVRATAAAVVTNPWLGGRRDR